MPKKIKAYLLIRGLTRGQGHWGDFPAVLKSISGRDPFFLDLPGNGERYRDSSPWKVSDYVESMRPQATQLLSYFDFTVVAISMGAMVACEWMQLYPNDFSQAFFINTSSANHSKAMSRFLVKNLTQHPQLFTAENREANILEITSNFPDRGAQFLSQFTDYGKTHPIRFKNILAQMKAASSYGFPPKSPGKITLITSQKDRLVSSDCTYSIAKDWGIEPLVHPTAGHDLPLDDPQWLALNIQKYTNPQTSSE